MLCAPYTTNTMEQMGLLGGRLYKCRYAPILSLKKTVKSSGIEVTMPDETTIEAFRANLHGELIEPSDTSYEAARKVYNCMIDRRPRLIAYGPEVELRPRTVYL